MRVRARSFRIARLGALIILASSAWIVSVDAFEERAPTQDSVLSFFDRLCEGDWYGGFEGAPFPAWPKRLSCPGSGGDSNGFVWRLTSSDTLESGSNGSRAIESYPTMQNNGFIRGTFSLSRLGVTLQNGDHFKAEIGFVQDMTSAQARFKIIYDPDPIESGDEHLLADMTKGYTGTLRTVDVNLGQFAGQGGDLILRVETAGSYTQDRAVWVNPRIDRPAPPTAIPSPTTYVPPATDAAPTPFATTPAPQKASPTPTFTKPSIPDCKGPVSLSQEPMEPDPSEQVTFLASAEELCDVARIDIFVNNENVHTCSKMPCEYYGGPFPDGVDIFDVVAEGIDGEFLPSENVIVNGISTITKQDPAELTLNPCPLCPDQPHLGPCVEQICYGPSQPDYAVQEQNFIGCVYEGQDSSQPWTLLALEPIDGWYTDTCLSSNILTEYYCQGTGGLRELHYTCPFACNEGACIECNDSDGGVSPHAYGITSWGVEDTCLNENTLREYFVTPENNACALYYTDIECLYGCNQSIRACSATCTDGIQNQNETGVDCGGVCPATCMQCAAEDIDWDSDLLFIPSHSKFNFDDPLVHDTAMDALMEYTNCLRSDTLMPVDLDGENGIEPGEVAICSWDLGLKVFSTNYHSLTAFDLIDDLDAIMEAVAWYVDEHMGYLGDGSRGSNVPQVQSASYTLQHSGDRGCTVDNAHWTPLSPAAYCGDCEDFCILRNTLMRYLGVSPDCAFCADKINKDDGSGGGHSFNIVRYRNKFRIMDYGPVGVWLDTASADRVPFNLWNDVYGDYWCYLDKSKIAGPAGCWRVQPWDRTWNYTSGNRCPSTWEGNLTYRTSVCP